jgi:hypothetical protein
MRSLTIYTDHTYSLTRIYKFTPPTCTYTWFIQPPLALFVAFTTPRIQLHSRPWSRRAYVRSMPIRRQVTGDWVQYVSALHHTNERTVHEV